jgi:hypothetical protein
MRYLVLILAFITLGCERDLNIDTNYQYMFQALYEEDQWGIEHWGGHLFVMDEPIKDMASFKECYVKYLDWGMGDKIPKKIYYEDDKHIKIEFVRETKYNWTVPEVNDCQ